MQIGFNSLLNHWFANHPFIFWLYQHPVIALVITFVLGVILWRLLAAIAFAITSVIDRVWLWIFRSPILLLKSLFGISEEISEPEKLALTINPTQFRQITNQLDRITAQQQLIIQEINTLKQAQEITKTDLLVIDQTEKSEIINQTLKIN